MYPLQGKYTFLASFYIRCTLTFCCNFFTTIMYANMFSFLYIRVDKVKFAKLRLFVQRNSPLQQNLFHNSSLQTTLFLVITSSPKTFSQNISAFTFIVCGVVVVLIAQGQLSCFDHQPVFITSRCLVLIAKKSVHVHSNFIIITSHIHSMSRVHTFSHFCNRHIG